MKQFGRDHPKLWWVDMSKEEIIRQTRKKLEKLEAEIEKADLELKNAWEEYWVAFRECLAVIFKTSPQREIKR